MTQNEIKLLRRAISRAFLKSFEMAGTVGDGVILAEKEIKKAFRENR